jgi:hypothetical protein
MSTQYWYGISITGKRFFVWKPSDQLSTEANNHMSVQYYFMQECIYVSVPGEWILLCFFVTPRWGKTSGTIYPTTKHTYNWELDLLIQSKKER